MTKFNYALKQEDYTLQNALLWGVALGHWQKVQTGNLGNRCVHALIATVHTLPIIGQISSLAERYIVTHFSDQPLPDLTQRKVTPINDKEMVDSNSAKTVTPPSVTPLVTPPVAPLPPPVEEAVKKALGPAVKGSKFKDFQDIKEYYEARLLPLKTTLDEAEFSKRSGD